MNLARKKVIRTDKIWKPVAGYEGLYEVSNMGDVKSLCAGRWKKEMMRRPVADKNGYHTVCLKKDGVVKNLKVHRLVAEAFIPNPNNYPQINHKDEDKTNNRVENLEWCTCKYNMNYHDHFKAYYKPVVMVRNGQIIKRFNSIKEAAAEMNINDTSISMVLHGKRKKAGGYEWQTASV